MKKTKYPIHPDFRRWTNMNPPLNRAALPVLRRLLGMLFLFERSSAEVAVRRLEIPTFDGKRIRALMYAPVNESERLPCLFYFHGGGYVFPAAPYQYRLAREYSKKLRCKVVFADYRLAPKHPFPIAVEDCFAAYSAVIDRADELGIDKSRTAVIGDSAGGCLATVVCMMARERGSVVPRNQILTYPAVGLSFETESMREFTDTPMCNSVDAKRYEALYIRDEGAGKLEYRAPIESDDLSGMPPAYIETAEFDCLRDGGILYAEKLKNFGVHVELNETRGTIHGFDIVKDSPIVRECVERRIAFIREYWR